MDESDEKQKTENIKVEEEEKILDNPEEENANIEDENNNSNDNKKQKKKMSKGKKALIIIIIIFVLCAIGCLIYFLGFAKKNINMTEYLCIEYEGYNGNASVTMTIDVETLGEYLDDESLANNFAKKTTLELDKVEDLSNGDEITVTVLVDDDWLKDNKLKIKENPVIIEVEGLEDANVIDLSKYIKITYEGPDGAATANVELKTDELEEFIGDLDLTEEFEEKIELEIEDNIDLKNGDYLIIDVEIDEDWLESNGLELKEMQIKIKIDGIGEGIEVDAFNDINISVSGISPNMRVAVSTNSNDEFIKTIKYTLDKSTGISNGETITITAASWDKDMAKEKGYVLRSTTYKYTVSVDEQYPMKASELSSANILELEDLFSNQAKLTAEEEMNIIKDNYSDYKTAGVNEGWDKSNFTNDWKKDLTINEPTLVSLYILASKEAITTCNYIYGIYKITYSSSLTGADYDWYITISSKDIFLDYNGTLGGMEIHGTTDNGSSQDTAYNAYINSKKDNYTIESI